ncbi:MAG: fumarylacetoacetate hydrolase family protein, partial [Candidatus Bathyarchaeia archaeon]
MRLLTFRKRGEIHVGALKNGKILDINRVYEENFGGAFDGYDNYKTLDMIAILKMGVSGLEEISKALDASREGRGPVYNRDNVELLAPIPKPLKNIVCLGLNYAEHVKEGSKEKGDLPVVPIYFTKPPTVVTGPYNPIIYPPSTNELDYEVELAFVIGKRGRYIHEDEALKHIAGYTVFNDVSARDLQRRHRQWFKGKSCDSFAPMGPYLVTPDEVGDPQDLDLWTKVNGEIRQKANTGDMIFTIKEILSDISKGITLE